MLLSQAVTMHVLSGGIARSSGIATYSLANDKVVFSNRGMAVLMNVECIRHACQNVNAVQTSQTVIVERQAYAGSCVSVSTGLAVKIVSTMQS